MDTTKKFERCLQGRIDFLRNLKDLSSIVKPTDDHNLTIEIIKDALQLAKRPRDVHRFLKCIGLVEDIIEIYVGQGKEATWQLIYSLAEIFIDLVTYEGASVCVKMELSRIFNVILEGCSLKVAQELMKRDGFLTKIENLFSKIQSAGDFELQVMLIESLLRLIPQPASRESIFKKLIPDKFLLSCFLNIRDSHFDVDCRKFLNRFNIKENSSDNRIYSFPVENVKLDGEQLYKPEDDGYDEFWIDFNTGSKRISLFCQSTLLPSQLSQSAEPRWETLSLRASDIKRYNCNAKNKFWVLTVELRINAQMLTNREPEKQPHLFICQVPQIYEVPSALSATLKLAKRKASVPQNLFSPQKTGQLQVQDSSNPITKKQQDHINSASKSHSDLHTSQNKSSQKKCSVPVEPLSIITSSISSTDGTRHISWQSIYSRINDKKCTAQCNDLTSEKNMPTKPAQRWMFGHSKNTAKCSIVNSPLRSSFDLLEMRRERIDSVHLLDNDLKSYNEEENTGNEKPEEMALGIDNYPSPMTASGDYVCPPSKSGIPSSVGNSAISNTVEPECQPSTIETKSLRNRVNANNSLEKTSAKKVKKVTCSSRNENGCSSRNSSLRSGKKIMTPVVSLESIATRTKQKHKSVKEANADQSKIDPRFSKSSLIKKKTETQNTRMEKAVADNKSFVESCIDSKKKSGDQNMELRTPNYTVKPHKDKTTNGSLDDFKTPKTFNLSKNQGRKKKSKKGIENYFPNCNTNSKDISKPTYSTEIVDNNEKNNTMQSFERKKVGKEADRKMSVISNQEAEHQNKSLSNEVTVSNDPEDTITESSESIELYVEVERTISKDTGKKFRQETRIDETPDMAEDCKTGYDNNNTLNSNQNEDLNGDIIIGATCNDLATSKQLKASNDTQTSNTVMGSYVFKRKDNNKVGKTNDMNTKDDMTDNCTSLKENKYIKNKETSACESNTFLKNKNNASYTNKENEKLKQTDYNMNMYGMKKNYKSIKETQNKINMGSVINPTSKKMATVPESSPTVTSSNDLVQTSCGDTGKSTSKPGQRYDCRRNLRARNKEICYAECDSVNGSSTKLDEMDEAIQPKRSLDPNIVKLDNVSFLSRNSVDTSPPLNYTKSNDQKDKTGNQSISSKNGPSSQRYRIWRSQEIKTTVTTIPLQDTPDPYDFEAECISRLHNIQKLTPYKSNSNEGYDNHKSASYSPSQKNKHRKSKQFVESNHHFQQKVSSRLSNFSTKVEFKNYTWKASKVNDEKCFTKRFSESELANTSDGSAQSSHRNKEVMKSNKLFSPKKDDAVNSDDGGLVFPPLEDAIPCTPYSYQSKGTELSWIAKRKTTPERREKMRGKTYSHNTIHGRNNEKMTSLFTTTSNASYEYEKLISEQSDENTKCLDKSKVVYSNKSRTDNQSRRHNIFNDSDLVISQKDTSRKSCKSVCNNPKRNKKKRTSSPVFDPMSKVLTSEYGREPKVSKRKLSFDVNSLTDKKSITSLKPTSGAGTNSFQNSLDSSSISWSWVSSKAEQPKDHTVDSPSDEVPILFRGIESVVSGPSSTQRLNKSALKRKYPSASSDSGQELSSDLCTEENSPKLSRLLPRKLFDSEIKFTKSLDSAKRTIRPNQNHSVKASGDNLSSDDGNPSPSKYINYDFNPVSVRDILEKTDSKSRKAMENQNNKNNLSSFTRPKKTNILKSSRFKEPSCENSECSLSSPEISSNGIEKHENSQPLRENKTNLNLGFSSGICSFDFYLSSPKTISSQESFKIGSSVTDYRCKSKSISLKNSEDQDEIDDNTKEMDYNDEDYNSCSNRLSDLIQMRKNNTAVPSQASSMSDTAQHILKSTNHVMESSWGEGKGKRSKAIIGFDRCLQTVMKKTEKFSKEMKEAELKINLLLSQQIQRLRSHREFSEQSLESMKHACEDLLNEVQDSHKNQDQVKKSVKSALKKDFDALTSSVKTKFNEQSLEAMRRCLQASFMLS